MAPAQKRFGTRQQPAVQLRLIKQGKLIFTDGQAKIPFKRDPGVYGRLQGRGEEEHRIASRRLCLVHRDISLLQYFIRAFVLIAKDRDTHARGCMALAALQQERLIDSCEYLATHRTCLCCSDLRNLTKILQNNDELIAAESRNGVHFTHAILDASPRLL